MGSTEQWACQELEKLGLCDPEVIIRYLQPIEDTAEVEEYLSSLLDPSQPPQAAFIREFVRRQQEAKEAVDNRFYRKPDLETTTPPSKGSEKKKQKGPKESNGRGQRDGGGAGGGGGGGSSSVTSPSTPGTPNTSSSGPSSTPSSGKKKFTNLYSEDGASRDVVLLSGRHRCECQASKHRLVGNCLQCGRVVCQQEGSGPCQFCGALVMTREERELLGRGSKKSEALQRRLLSEKNATVSELPPPKEEQNDAFQKAVDHKNRLLEFDRTSERRTKVHDDESDYFNTDSRWLSEGDRNKLREREEELRAKRFGRGGQTVTLDLANRRVVADERTTAIYDPNDPLVKEVLEGRTSDIFSAPDREESGPKVEVSRPLYRETTTNNTTNIALNKPTVGKFAGTLRVQDRELQEMRDEGMCLSMHQPWASLLVAGIKLHEGRTWYSPHRGRLWIAAAAKTPHENDIRELENRYRVLLNDDNLPFPYFYPPGCLLGCVDVVDVLPQEEYRERFPDGDSQSPFVFICQNPQEMVLKFPIKGQHKIFKLDPKIHQTAKKALRPREE